jgi:hypothetical protein
VAQTRTEKGQAPFFITKNGDNSNKTIYATYGYLETVLGFYSLNNQHPKSSFNQPLCRLENLFYRYLLQTAQVIFTLRHAKSMVTGPTGKIFHLLILKELATREISIKASS